MVREGVDGIAGVLKALKMLPGAPEPAQEYREMSSFAWLHGRTGGVFSPRVTPGDRVAKGQAIASMTSILGERLEDIRSPVDGIILTIGHGTLMPVGGTLAEIGVERG
jgi:predicted deacylase